MIDAAQIRAARSLLRWTLDRLHKASGVSINGINQIERDKVSAPRQETLDSLQKAFEAAGVEFLPNSGVRKKDRIVETYEGRGSNRRLIEDIYWTLHNSGGGEILIAHLDEDRAIKELGKSFIEEQIRLRKAAKITHRLLVRANDPGLIPPVDTYHRH